MERNDGVSGAMVKLLIAEHERVRRPRLERLWRYYYNVYYFGVLSPKKGLSGPSRTTP